MRKEEEYDIDDRAETEEPYMLEITIMEELMRNALTLALRAQECDEVPIGALVYSEEYGILGEGFNKTRMENDPTAHAEIVAIRHACAKMQNYRLPTCYLITTIEPCIACFGSILHTRLQGIIYGAAEPKMGAITHLVIPSHLQTHLKYVYGGILAHECKTIIQEFFQKKRIENTYK